MMDCVSDTGLPLSKTENVKLKTPGSDDAVKSLKLTMKQSIKDAAFAMEFHLTTQLTA